MARYLEHPSRAGRWSGDAFELLPGVSSQDETVWFSLAQSGDDEVWEGLLARRLHEGLVEIMAVPVFAYDLGLGDQVAVTASGEGALVATRLVRDAGRFTYRVFFPEEGDGSGGPNLGWRALAEALAPFGCWLDIYSPSLVAVSADVGVAQAVADFLAEQARQGRLQYETGRTRPPMATRPGLR